MLKKAQTAMEYLMTYGWAILIVIVVVAALYAMGVFSVKPRVPCSPCFSYFAFVDYSAATGTLKIRNGPQAISNLQAWGKNATGQVSNLTVSPTSAAASEDITVSGLYTASGITNDITVQYTVTASGLAHNDTATLHNP